MPISFVRSAAPLLRPRLVGATVAAAVALMATACTGTPVDTPVAQGPAFDGISVASADHSVAVRDLFVPDPGPAGYPAGSAIPVIVQVWNNTNRIVSLTGAMVTGGPAASLVDATATATAPATTFDVPIGAAANVRLTQQAGRFLQIRCAARSLSAGTTIGLTFTFSNGATIAANVPIGRSTRGPETGTTPAATAPTVATGC